MAFLDDQLADLKLLLNVNAERASSWSSSKPSKSHTWLKTPEDIGIASSERVDYLSKHNVNLRSVATKNLNAGTRSFASLRMT